MQLALIPPLYYLDDIEDQEMHLILPHMLIWERYARYVEGITKGNDRYVILDNGLAESRQYGPKAIFAIGAHYGVDEIVAPDVMGDAEQTILQAKGFRDLVKEWKQDMAWDGQIAYVAQGKHPNEAYFSAVEMINMSDEPCTIMIPRHLVTEQEPHARLKIVNALVAYLGPRIEQIDIHLLGGSRWYPKELQDAAFQFGEIRSMDTSMPYVFARHHAYVTSSDRPPHRDSSESYWSWEASAEQDLIVKHNVSTMREWTRGA